MSDKFVAIVVGLLLLLGVLELSAQEQDPRYRVYIDQSLDFFPDPNLSRQTTPQLNTSVLVKAIEDYFRSQDERFVVVPSDALFQRFDNPEGEDGISTLRVMLSLKEAEGALKSGVTSISRFDWAGAEQHLKESTAFYEEIQAPLLLRRELAEVYLYLGLVYTEQENREKEALDAFTRMLRLDGRRVLVDPYYQERAESLYKTARARLLRQDRSQGVSTTDSELVRDLSRLVDADIVVWGYAEQEGEMVTLHLQMYRRGKNKEEIGFSPVERIELTSNNPVNAERASRLASRLASCIEPLPEPPPPPEDWEKHRFYLDSSFAYYVYLSSVEALFNNFGFSVAGTYLLNENFALVGRLNFLTSTNDAEETFLNEFSSVRAFAGGGFSLRLKPWVRTFAHFSFEGLRSGEFQRTTDFFCKVNRNAPNCQPDDINTVPASWFAGINTLLGTSFRLYDNLHMVVSGSFSFYFFPLSRPEINFPLGTDVGLEYRF